VALDRPGLRRGEGDRNREVQKVVTATGREPTASQRERAQGRRIAEHVALAEVKRNRVRCQASDVVHGRKARSTLAAAWQQREAHCPDRPARSDTTQPSGGRRWRLLSVRCGPCRIRRLCARLRLG
jgi:hypothetical protein